MDRKVSTASRPSELANRQELRNVRFPAVAGPHVVGRKQWILMIESTMGMRQQLVVEKKRRDLVISQAQDATPGKPIYLEAKSG